MDIRQVGKQRSRCKVASGPFQRLRRHFHYEGIDFLAECTDAEGTDCWILEKLASWNRILHYAGLELVEQEPHTVQLNSLQLSFKVRYPHSDFVRECGTLICWLLEKHRCVTSFSIKYDIGTFWGKKILSDVTNNLPRVLCFELDHRDPEQRRRGPKALEGVDVLEVVLRAESIERFMLRFVTIDSYKAWHLGSTLGKRASLKELVLEDAEGYLDLMYHIPRNYDRGDRVVRGEGYDVLLQKFSENLNPATALQKVEVRRSALGDASVRAFVEALRQNATVVSLTLYNCSLSPTHARLLAGVLKTNSSIVDLNLSSNRKIGDTGIIAIASALRHNTALTRVDLCQTGMEKCGLSHLCEVVKERDKLTHLDLSSNMFGDEGCPALAGVISTTLSLKHLRVCECDIGEPGIMSVASALKENRSSLRMAFGYYFADKWSASSALRVLMERGVLHRTDGVWYAPSEGSLDVLPEVISEISEMKVPPLCSELVSLSKVSECMKEGVLITRLGVIDLEFMHNYEAVMKLIENTTALKELCFYFYTLRCKFVDDLCKALARNKSLRQLRITARSHRDYSTNRCPLLAIVEMLNVNKTLLSLELRNVEAPLCIAQAFANSLRTNYGLTHFKFDTDYGEDCAVVMMDIERIVRRNAGLCTKAVHFLSHETLQKRYAMAFDLTADTGSLEERVAELSGKSPGDAQTAIRSKMRFLHRNFFTVTGIVKNSITCHCTDRKQMQIDCLDAPSLAHIASYLKIADVR